MGKLRNFDFRHFFTSKIFRKCLKSLFVQNGFSSKSTKCSFRKLLTLVAYSNAPFIFYIFIFDISLIYFTFIPYTWYCISLIIGIKEVLKYENYFKSIILTLAPQILFLIWFLSQFSNVNNVTLS